MMWGSFVVFIISVKVIKKILIVFLVFEVYLWNFNLVDKLLSFCSKCIFELLVKVVLKLVWGRMCFVIIIEMNIVGII